MKHSKRDENSGRKKKHRLSYVLAALLLVIIVGISWLFLTQRNNLKALYLAMKNDQNALEQIQKDQQTKRDELLDEYGLTRPTFPQAGELTQLPTEVTPVPSSAAPPAVSNQPAPTPDSTSGNQPDPASGDLPDEQKRLQMELQQKVNRLYEVEEQYRNILSSMTADTKREFWSLPKDQQTKKNKVALVQSKAETLIEKEKECDAEVDAILSDIRDILKQLGKSNDLADQISTYYEESKASWKAAQMTELYK